MASLLHYQPKTLTTSPLSAAPIQLAETCHRIKNMRPPWTLGPPSPPYPKMHNSFLHAPPSSHRETTLSVHLPSLTRPPLLNRHTSLTVPPGRAGPNRRHHTRTPFGAFPRMGCSRPCLLHRVALSLPRMKSPMPGVKPQALKTTLIAVAGVVLLLCNCYLRRNRNRPPFIRRRRRRGALRGLL